MFAVWPAGTPTPKYIGNELPPEAILRSVFAGVSCNWLAIPYAVPVVTDHTVLVTPKELAPPIQLLPYIAKMAPALPPFVSTMLLGNVTVFAPGTI